MGLVLLVLIAVGIIWLARGRPHVASDSPLARFPLIGARPSREKFKLALGDALNTRGAATGQASVTLQNFSAWLNRLPDKELDRLALEVGDDCKGANIQLEWLLDGRAKGEMRETLLDTVMFSALTVWRGRAAEPFVRLEDYIKYPNARHNRKFGQDVFGRLVNTGRIVIPSELLIGSEQARHEFALDSITNLAQQDQDALIAVVRETMGIGPSPETTQAELKSLAPGQVIVQT